MIEELDYVHKVKPFAHQQKAFERFRDATEAALLHEQGTGKTKTQIDCAAWKYMKGDIEALVVLAPNGVHVNWVKEELPRHMPDYIDTVPAWWRASPNAKEKKALAALMDTKINGLRVFTMNVEAVSTKRGQIYLKNFLLTMRCMLVLDESHRFATPGAKRTKFILNVGQHALARFISTGTSMSTGPLNLYAQFKFLDPAILGHSTYTSFKNRYAEWERRTVQNQRGHYDHLIGYKNLSELTELIKPVVDRVKKSDCLDLPDKLYKKIYVQLSQQQRAAYKSMMDDSIVALRTEYLTTTGVTAPDGDNETQMMFFMLNEDVPKAIAKNAAIKSSKLKQISSGFLIDEESVPHRIEGPNPKLNALLDSIQDYDGKILIWAWYREEIEMIVEALREKYGEKSTVHYYGGTTSAEKEISKDRFVNDPECLFHVGNPHSAGIGLTYVVSSTSFYFSRVAYEKRAQSEDRNHRIGQTKNVTYVDFIAQDTVEEKADAAVARTAEIIGSVYKLLEE